MWERNAEAMQRALARHDEILQSVIEINSGYVFKTVGDAFCAAFASAPDALEAALSAQRALYAEDWNEGCTIRARMALHTGTAEERGGDYFGPPVNRVARLLSAGHGGQTLLSLATQELVRDQLPSRTGLRDLGERRLKDLIRPERIFQLAAPELPSNLPPLKTLDERLNNLPVQPTPLVGREKEVEEVCGLLRRDEVRLLTLTGPGGTGKTRLALQAAAELLDRFKGGVFFVVLAAITDPELVASAIAKPLGVQESADLTLTEALKYYLRGKELLLLLDNFEQVLEASPLVGELVAACPRLKVLVTSRTVLHLYGEHEYAVPPLSLPDPKRLPDLAALSQYEAVRLFIERAQAARADFEVTNENAPAVAEICARLDGLPLAIELAAARIKLLSPQAMLPRLGNRLKLLARGARDLPERQKTLRGTIEWSHDLLDEGEKTLFARLAVFAGGRTLEAIEAVCDPQGELPVDPLDGISSLLDKSLLRQEKGGREEEPRLVMLETIHEYAREKLEQSGEAEEVRKLHAEYFLALAEEAGPELKGPRQVEWLEQLETEHDNLRAALSGSLAADEAEPALRLAGALWWFWFVRGHLTDGRRWVEETLAKDGGSAMSVRAKALTGAGRLLLEQGDPEQATLLLAEGVTLFREAGHKQGLADSLDNLGIAWAHQGELERSTALFEESLELFQDAGDGWGVAECLNNLALIAGIRNERERETALHGESLKVSRELGDKRGITMSLVNLANTTLNRGDYERAAMLCDEGLALGRELGDKSLTAELLGNLGLTMLFQGDSERATKLFEESLIVVQELGDRYHLYADLMCLASAAAAERKSVRSARLFGAARGIRESTGIALLDLEHRLLYERFLAISRSQLEEEAWEAASELGRSMTVEEAIAYALKKSTHT
jgi:predicted ATPase